MAPRARIPDAGIRDARMSPASDMRVSKEVVANRHFMSSGVPPAQMYWGVKSPKRTS